MADAGQNLVPRSIAVFGADDPDRLGELVSERFISGPIIRVAEERIRLFADATDDHQWIHVDPKRAAEGPYKVPVAHGFLTMGLLYALRPEPWYMIVGAESVRPTGGKYKFIRPVPVGAEIQGSERIKEAKVDLGGVVLTIEYQVRLVDGNKLALSGEIDLLYS